MTVTLVPVRGTYLDSAGEPMSGRITFRPTPARMTDTEDDVTIIGGQQVTAELDETGSFEVELFATDDPSLNPTNFTWFVAERIRNGSSYYIETPMSAAAAGIDLVDVAPVARANGVAITRGEPGEPGADGEDGAPGTVPTEDIEAAVIEAVEANAAGITLAVAKRTTNFVADTATAVSSFSITVVGTGNPVDIEFSAAKIYHNVTIGAVVTATIYATGGIYSLTAIASDARSSFATANGPAVNPKALDMVLTDGVSYTFVVYLSDNTAGNSTLFASTAQPMVLRATAR